MAWSSSNTSCILWLQLQCRLLGSPAQGLYQFKKGGLLQQGLIVLLEARGNQSGDEIYQMEW